MVAQAERRANTRQVLLDAAADVLVADGLAGFTTAAVIQQAQVSNGALFGHFPSRLELLAATVEHVLARVRSEYDLTFSVLESDDTSIETLLELLWASINDPSFRAVIGVYTQARTDPDLLAAIHEIVVAHGSFVGDINRRVARTFSPDDVRAARLQALGTVAILAMQGLLVSHMVGASIGAERDLIAVFSQLFHESRQVSVEA